MSNQALEHQFNYVRSHITNTLLLYYDKCENKLCETIRYSVLNNGKKYRPFLLWGSGQALEVDEDICFKIGAVLEILHTYSLIHDDLPCMDNDNKRHGKPALHKEYSESIAILTGDAILTDAFAFLSDKNIISDSEVALDIIHNIATYLGSSGMVLGQTLEMLITSSTRMSVKQIKQIHYLKTAKFMEVAVLLGGIIAKVDDSIKNKLILFGRNIGLVFQMLDDIEDFAVDNDMINICNFTPLSNIKNEIKSLIDEAIAVLLTTEYNFTILISFANYLKDKVNK